jgi:transcriptional regulator with XRE-family HTH domain
MATLFATPRARALGFGLRTVREARGYGVRELARRADLNPQDLSKWEYGKRVPTVEAVALLLGALQAEPEERERLLELARTAREPSWLERTMPGAPPALAAFVEYERTATTMFEWLPTLVPGLLQTPAYIRSIFAATSLPAAGIEKLVMIRLARRAVFGGRTPLQYSLLLGEAALRQGIGGDEVMAEQLRHMLGAARASNVSVRVVPSANGYHPGLYGPFVIFDFADLPPIVHLEHYRGSGYLYDEDQVAAYRAATETIGALAMSEQDSGAFIEGVILQLEA